MNDQSIEKIPKDLIAAFHIFWMAFFSEERTKLTFWSIEIDQFQNFDDFIISEVKGYPEFFKDVVIGHCLGLMFI